jgi:hypothetical protein
MTAASISHTLCQQQKQAHGEGMDLFMPASSSRSSILFKVSYAPILVGLERGRAECVPLASIALIDSADGDQHSLSM